MPTSFRHREHMSSNVETLEFRCGGSCTPNVARCQAFVLLSGRCTSPNQCRDALLTAARKHFNSTELTALREAIERGFQPVDDER